MAVGKKLAEETGATLVPPYDHPWTIAGQGTAVLELLEEVPDLDVIVVCIGGGGLMAGSAIAAKSVRPSIRVIGVEPADANDTKLSIEAGKRVEISPPATIADGLRAQIPGELTFPIMQRLVDEIVLVSEEEIRGTMKFLLIASEGAYRAERRRIGRVGAFQEAAAGVGTGGRCAFGRQRGLRTACQSLISKSALRAPMNIPA